MSQNDFTIANQSFPAFRADLNSALQALASNSSGGSAPSTTFANMWWYDSSNNIMYIRNEDNDAWIKFAELDQANDKFVLSGTLQLDDGTVSAPALTFNSDTNMGIYRGGTDILKFVTAGQDRLTINAGGNVGIGTVPSAWNTFTASLQIDGASLSGLGANNTALASNAYYDSAWKYYGTGSASLYQQNSGLHRWDIAGSGTAGNTIAFTEAMRIDSSGNVGIGTSSPSGAAGTTLAINGGSGQSRLALKNTSTGDASGDGFQLSVGTDGSVGIEQRENNYMALYTNATERMRITSAGNVGIGETVPLGILHIKEGDSGVSSVSTDADQLVIENNAESGISILAPTNSASRIAFGDSDNNKIGQIYYNHTSNFMKFDVNGSERMRLDSSGHLLLRSEATNRIELGSYGTSGTNSSNFIRGNNDTIDLNTGGGNYTFEVNGAVKVQFDTNGTVRNSTGTYTTISDQTLKENIIDANSQWDDIKALRIRNFNFIGDDLTQLGVIAQEVESAGMNGLVEDVIWDGEEVKSVKQSIIYMKAVKALQEAITRIETLETANTALEERITALENGA